MPGEGLTRLLRQRRQGGPAGAQPRRLRLSPLAPRPGAPAPNSHPPHHPPPPPPCCRGRPAARARPIRAEGRERGRRPGRRAGDHGGSASTDPIAPSPRRPPPPIRGPLRLRLPSPAGGRRLGARPSRRTSRRPAAASPSGSVLCVARPALRLRARQRSGGSSSGGIPLFWAAAAPLLPPPLPPLPRRPAEGRGPRQTRRCRAGCWPDRPSHAPKESDRGSGSVRAG